MVSFKLLTSALALATPIIAQSTPAQIVTQINDLTSKTTALQPQAETVSLINGPLIIIGEGPLPKIIRGYVDIVQTGQQDTQSLTNTPTIPAGADADAINQAWTRVRV